MTEARAFVLGAPLALLIATSAFATTVRHLDTRELTLDSQDIVIGRVDEVRSYWNPSHTRILTDVTVQVSESFKGVAAGRLTLTQLGGEVDGARYSVPGGPLFKPGEEALLFVWRDAKGNAQVNAMAQGKFDIRTDISTGERFAQRSAPGFGVRDVKTLRLLTAGQPAPQLRCEDLVREIRRTLAEQSVR